MRSVTQRSWIILFLCACSSAPMPEKSLYVAEGEHHVAAWSERDASSASGSDQMAALIADIRAAHGNIAVYVMRGRPSGNSVVILTIWKSQEDLTEWRRQRLAERDTEYDVLFELTK